VSIVGFERYWACRCGPGYWGETCSRFTCAASCLHGGTCVDQDVCSCFPGFRGAACEIDCGCGGHGTCAPDGSCLCDAGWRPGPGGGQCEWDCDCPGGAACAGPGICPCANCAHGTCVRGQCQCWAGYSEPECDVPVARPNADSPIGMNLNGVGYGLERIYVDVMKHASDWVSVAGQDVANASGLWGDGQPILQGADGYLLQVYPPAPRALSTAPTVFQSHASFCRQSIPRVKLNDIFGGGHGGTRGR
jgi:hypothetical protein